MRDETDLKTAQSCRVSGQSVFTKSAWATAKKSQFATVKVEIRTHFLSQVDLLRSRVEPHV